MQKDEEDILEEWIIYHSHLFGIENLYIIDNNSRSDSWEILHKYESKGLHVSSKPDYALKGDYLCALMKETQDQCDLAIPLDIDEFVACVNLNNMPLNVLSRLARLCLSFDPNYYMTQYPQIHENCKLTAQEALEHYIARGFHFGWSPCHDHNIRTNLTNDEYKRFLDMYGNIILKHYPKETLSCDREQIIQHIENLPKNQGSRYVFLYYLTSRNTEMCYENPIDDLRSFDLVDYERKDGKCNENKKFFNPKHLLSLDHGNHQGTVDDLPKIQSIKTQLVLFHLHHRGVRKLIDKCMNDIRGLHIVTNLNDERELREKIKQRVHGSHNIETYLTYLTAGPCALLSTDDEGIPIGTLANKINDLKSQQ
jgi:hypothetical protein